MSNPDLTSIPGNRDLASVMPAPDLATSADLNMVDLRTPPDLLMPGDGGIVRAITWKLIGTLGRWPQDPSDIVVVMNAIYSPVDSRTWDMTNANWSNSAFMSAMNVTFRQNGCACFVGNHEYILGGGGDGVISPYSEPTYLDADFTQRTVTSHAANWTAHDTACVLGNKLCYVIGGNSSPNGPFGLSAVRVFDPAKGTFVAGPAVPVPTSKAAVAVGGGQFLLAGGYCSGAAPCPPKNDPSGMPVTVLSNVYSADAVNPVWTPQPMLPRPVTGAGMLFLANRFYLVGGSASAYGPINPNGVLSLAIGENAWRDDGKVPGMGPVVSVITDGTDIFIVVYENFEYRLYRGVL